MSKVTRYIKRGIQYILHGQPIVNTYAHISVLAPNDLLKGRTALVTGGTSGIGKSIVEAFLNAGANVVFTSRSQSRATTIADELQMKYPNSKVMGVAMDNADISSLSVTYDEIVKAVKKIDILVNNAGLRGGRWGDFNEEEYDNVMDTNLKGVFFLSELVAKYMITNSIQGNILNICSASSLRPANSAYSLSKWGIRAMTAGMAKTLIKHNIIVNGIAPGPTASPMFGMNSSDDITAKMQPNGRYALTEEIANMAVIYVSDMGRSLVGDIAYMTGGAGLITFDDNTYNF